MSEAKESNFFLRGDSMKTLKERLTVQSFSAFCFLFLFTLIGCGNGKPKIALVLSVGGIEDKSFNQSAYEGLRRAGKELRIKTIYAEPKGIGEFETSLRKFADEKYDLIIAIGFLQKSSVEKVAPLYPKTKFAILDAVAEGTNVASLTFREDEGSFLVGAIAGLVTATGRIGFVGGMKSPLIQKFEEGYRSGLKYVNPKAELLVGYIGNTPAAFEDMKRATILADQQYAQNADIIYHAAGGAGRGVIMEASRLKKFAIGVDSNQNYIAPGKVLTSMVKRVDVAVFDVISKLVEKKFKAGVTSYGLSDGAVGYAMDENNQDLIPYSVIQRVDEIREEIISGKIIISRS